MNRRGFLWMLAGGAAVIVMPELLLPLAVVPAPVPSASYGVIKQGLWCNVGPTYTLAS